MIECPRCQTIAEIRADMLSKDSERIAAANQRIASLALFSDYLESPNSWHGGLATLIYGKRQSCSVCGYPIGEGKKHHPSAKQKRNAAKNVTYYGNGKCN